MKRKIIISFIIITFISMLLTITNSFAKYVSNFSWSYNAKSREFYFDSDTLGKSGTIITNNFWDEQEINFDLKNYSNNKLISDMDINYKVSCEIVGDLSSKLSCMINNKSNTISDSFKSSGTCKNSTEDGIDVSEYTSEKCLNDGYTWNANKISNTYKLQVLNPDNYDYSDIKVLVKAISSSPYSKTLEATYNLHKELDKNIISEYTNYGTYGRLLMNNSSSNSICVKTSWDSKEQIIDNTGLEVSSSTVSEQGYINQIIFKINSNSSRDFLFYNQTDKEKSINDFTIETISDC